MVLLDEVVMDFWIVLGRDFLHCQLWNIVKEKKLLQRKEIKRFKIIINKIFPPNLKQTYLRLPKCTSMVE